MATECLGGGNPFDLQRHIEDIHNEFPQYKYKPVIGITGNYGGNETKISEFYYKSVVAAGGTPIIIPPLADADIIANTLMGVDGLLLSGGADHNPLFSGEDPIPQLHGINDERDLAELLTARLAYERQLPILGICRGIQTLAIALGGHVAQDINVQLNARIKHSQEAERHVPTHRVKILQNTMLDNIFKAKEIAVNSFHHQAVDKVDEKIFRVCAVSSDGIIEAMESAEHKPVIGVQWHPECMREGLPLFEWLVGEADAFRRAHIFHDGALTVDSHCDTPMLFEQGADFTHRDNSILVDVQKMTEGRLDAAFMVAYLPQPKEKQPFADAVGISGMMPRAYADRVFDRIEQLVYQKDSGMQVAHTVQQLWEGKRNGKKSIILGIENGIALEHDLRNLEHFARRGVAYITLCHNGDNDICDSARGCATHGGVSGFGKDVIAEMNRLGIMVDLSHAAESSFYDALEMSSTPIICSHSCCRALCDHPRNLTDEQLRQLAQRGGVCQITGYHGFLRLEGEADVYDIIRHLEHAISIMGIDHVGIGSDFDGDGGVRGFASASDAINLTKHLLARRYTPDDLRKIWGGNFLRIMQEVQQNKK